MHRIVPSLLLLAGPSISAVAAVESQLPVVDEIVIEGTERVHPDRVRFILHTQTGEPLDPSLLAEDVRAIAELGPFMVDKVVREDSADGGIRVRFILRELPYIGEIRYTGLGFFQEQNLDKKLRSRVGGYLNRLVLAEDARTLVDHFQTKNYANVSVDPRISVDEDSGIAIVTFDVDLGQEILVGRTQYPDLPDGVYKFFLDQLVINGPKRPFSAERLSWDEEIVTRELRDAGYLDAMVTDIEVAFFDRVRGWEERRHRGPKLVADGHTNNRAVLTYRMEPGARYRLGKVQFVGNTVADETELRTAFGLEQGVWYERREVRDAIERAQTVIRDRGYARAYIEPITRPNMEDRIIDLTLRVSEGEPYRIGRIDIDGNLVTKDQVARRNIRLSPGEQYNQTNLNRSETLLRRTGIFSGGPGRPLRIERSFPDDRPEEVDLVAPVEEDPTGSFSASLGWQGGVGVVGSITYSERNFDAIGALTGGRWRGAAHSVDASLSWNEEATNFSVGFHNPSLFDGPYFFSLGFTRSDRREGGRRDWEELRLLSRASLGRRFWDDDLELSLGYRYTDIDFGDVDRDAVNDALDAEDSHVFGNTLFASQRLLKLDNPRMPTRGWSIELDEALTGGPLPSTNEFFEITFDADTFVPLSEADLGGVTYLHLGYRHRIIRKYGDSDRVPFYERYFGGGPSPQHRGYDRGDLTPLGTNRNGFETRLGGVTESLTTGEISYPLQGINSGFRAHVFTDVGWIWGGGENADVDDLTTAAGFGFRMPMAFPISLDFAWLVDGPDEYPSSQVHFSIGGVIY